MTESQKKDKHALRGCFLYEFLQGNSAAETHFGKVVNTLLPERSRQRLEKADQFFVKVLELRKVIIFQDQLERAKEVVNRGCNVWRVVWMQNRVPVQLLPLGLSRLCDMRARDLASTDYHLFYSLQDHLRGKMFNDRRYLETYLDDFFHVQPAEFYARNIEQLAVFGGPYYIDLLVFNKIISKN
uniref:HTH_48 domain-containing protein n=1 Tax=Caenorhabditis japonica TaxID=281687 RepID=A0A8R1E6C2_CAEJA